MRPRLLAQDWLDAAFTAGLCLIALLAWESTYRGPGLWVAGVGAIAAGIAVAVVVVALGGGLEFVILGTLLVYLVGSGPIVGLGPFGAGFPVTLQGWPLLTGTHPPIDATGLALLPVVLLCLAASAFAAIFAMRSHAAAVPLVPVVLLLVSALLLSRSEPVSALLHGLGFGVLALVWLRVRGEQTEVADAAPDPGRKSRVIAAAAMVAVAAVIATFVTGTGSGDGRLVLRGLLPAYDVAQLPTPLDSFRDYTRRKPAPSGNVFNAELLRVRGAPGGARIRFAALDTYDGTHWAADNDTDPERTDDRFLRLSSTIDNPAEGEPAEVALTLGAGWSLPWVPTTGALQSFDFLGDGSAAAKEDLRYDPATQSAVTTDKVSPGRDYLIDTVLTDERVTADLRPSTALDEEIYDRAAFLDPAVQGWSFGAESPMDAVLLVAERLKREGRYSDGAIAGEEEFGPGHSLQRLSRFVLTTPSVGNDEQYAAAMALMANRLRVPARVVVGALVPEDGVIQGKDVSAWVELRADDGAWYTLDTDRFMGDRPPPRNREPGGQRPDRIFPEETPDDTSPEERPEPQRPPEQSPEQSPEQADDADPETDPDAGPPVWPWLGLLLLALPGVIPAAKWWRRRRRLTAPRVSERYAGAWLELVDQARDLGRRVPAGLTRPAEARRLERGAELAAEADRKIFGAEEPDPRDADAFWALVRDERTGLSATYSRWQRLRAALSLTSLRRR